MLDGFDPYHKWLGIPSHEQPANYYRLLGLGLFEEDLDAIAAAADRMLKYVRDIASGEHRGQANVLLAELAAAKRCLLVVEQKRAYDAGLRAGQAAARQTKRKEPARTIKSPATVQIARVTSRRPTARHKSRRTHSSRHLIVAASTAVMIGLVILGMLFLGHNVESRKPVAGAPTAKTDAAMPQQQTTTAASSSTERAVETAGGEARKAEAKETAAEQSERATESPLPQFVGRTPVSVPPEKNETRIAAPTDNRPAPIDDSESSREELPEVEAMEGAEPRQELSAVREIDGLDQRGAILREVWTNVRGNNVEDFVQYLREHPEPDQTETVDRFETPEDFGDQYGQRLRGYLHPPASGSYAFSIRANAEGWLFVGTDATTDSKRRVEPKTAVELQANQVYYVEAIHKESTGRDYLSIGWKMPDGTEEKPIPGERLSVHYRVAPRHESEFVVLTPLSAVSSLGMKLDFTGDGGLLAGGHANDNETYRLTFASEIEAITAIRLEAIPDESLPALGPGRGVGGQFALAEVSATVSSREEPDTPHRLRFASAVDDRGRDLRRIVDGNEKTLWRVSGRGGQAVVTLVVDDPVLLTGGAIVGIELKQRESLGRFRMLATSAPDPLSLSPASQPTSEDESAYALFVNLGGDDFTTLDGVRWRASNLFDNKTFGHEGGRSVKEDLIANRVQGSAQRGIAAFRAVVPDGTYDVMLYFCEYWSTKPSNRTFAIAAEQRVVVANFDLLRVAGGFAKPLAYPIRHVTVDDGRLDLHFRATSDSASTILNAISIKQVR